MQIRKGPFGYFAFEKFDNPDILSSYAEEVIAGNKSDFYLKPSMEYYGGGVMCCYEFSGYVQITDAEFSVFSPQKRLSSHKKETKNLSLRRKAAGDLFYSIIQFLDNLISPSAIELDPDMVFTDPEGISIKLCCLPVKSNPEDINLSSLGASRLEKFLNCDFFKNALTDDEKNALVFSVKDNNEKMFLKIASLLKGADSSSVSINEGLIDDKRNSSDSSGLLNNLSKSERNLLLASSSSLLSLIFLFINLEFSSALAFLLTLFILISVFIDRKKSKEKIRLEKSLEQSKQRSSILFSDNTAQKEKETDETYAEQYQAQVGRYKPLNMGRLTMLTDNINEKQDYSVYLDETCIGSDCFLSDIVLDEPDIAPLHAVIKQENGTFYLMPKNGTGKTYIEDSPIENGRRYEIKSGQKITIGKIDFRFAVENGK